MSKKISTTKKPKFVFSQNFSLDDDGVTYCCNHCHKAYMSVKQAEGHFPRCKGLEATIMASMDKISKREEANNNIEINQLNGHESLGMESSSMLNPFQDRLKAIVDNAWKKRDVNTHTVSPNVPRQGRPSVTPSVTPSMTPSMTPSKKQDREDYSSLFFNMRNEIAQLRQTNKEMKVITGNHLEHFSKAKPTRTFGNPNELITSKLGEVSENKWIGILVAVTAALLIYNTFREQLKKAFDGGVKKNK